MPEWNSKADALQLWFSQPVGTAWRIPLAIPIRTIPGVIIVDASHKNGTGKGAIRSEGDGNRLAWRAPLDTFFGPAVEVNADSDVLLEADADPGKYIRTHVKTDYLQPGPSEQTVFLQDSWTGLTQDIAAADAAAGVTQEAVNLILRNMSSRNIYWISAWLEPGTLYSQISTDGVAWSAPTTEATGLVFGDLVPGAGTAFYYRVVIPPATDYNPKVPALLHFRFYGA